MRYNSHMSDEDRQAYQEQLAAITAKLNSDVYIYSGIINREGADRLVAEMQSASRKHAQAALILTTYGGEAESAYRLIRTLQRRYQEVILYVFGYCKSAGTLVALGATTVVMGDYGELGPLDVQLAKDDELVGQSSGLDVIQAMNLLCTQAVNTFETVLFQLVKDTRGQLSTKAATDIATTTVVGLFGPIYQQIEPTRLGATNRANLIALDYGNRLCEHKDAVQQLVLGYPSHMFVIDIEEAKALLGEDKVREPTPDEENLAILVGSITREPCETLTVKLLSQPMQEVGNDEQQIPERDDSSSEGSVPAGDGGRSIHESGDGQSFSAND